MKKISLYILLFAGTLVGCKKYLENKPDQKLAVPTTLADFQALLDRYPVINNSDCSAGEVSADNYYLADAEYLSLPQDNYRHMYLWQKDGLFPPLSTDWFYSYRPVFSANTVLNGLKLMPVAAQSGSDYTNVKGEASFIRAKSFLNIVSIWAAQYDNSNAAGQLGIPVKLGTDFNQSSVRSNLLESYAQIVNDLQTAIACLPVKPLHVMRASKPAAYAMLARTYLRMRQYDRAGLYADSCLQLYNTLLDYNSLNPSLSYPISQFNSEVIFENQISVVSPINNGVARIDSALYRSYDPNDLRKIIFFKSAANNTVAFRGSYERSANLFGGIATDEVYLMRAECFARAGQTEKAMKDLNDLLVKRFKTGTFVKLNATDQNDALNKILNERRKELLMRGLRWPDIKRLNSEGANILLTRKIQGQTYTLPPNDLRYALPIPDDIVQLTGMKQNPR